MLPNHLYKYVPLRSQEDETKQRRLDALLTTPRLWLADPASFNDPMDCKPGFRFDAGTQDDLEKFRRSTITHMVNEDHPNAGEGERRQLLKEYSNRYPLVDATFKASAHALLSKHLQGTVGVLCLSECGCDPVMFYHYGDRHAGHAQA